MPRFTALIAAYTPMLIAPSLGAIIPVTDWLSSSTAPALASTSTTMSLPEPQLTVSHPPRIPHIPVPPDYEDLSYPLLSTRVADYSRQLHIPTITANILKPQSGYALPRPTTTIEGFNSSNQPSATALSTVRPLPPDTYATGASLDARTAHPDEADEHPSGLSARTESWKGDHHPKYPKLTFNLTDTDTGGITNASHVAGSIMLQLEGALIVVPFSELFRDWLSNGAVFTAQGATKHGAAEAARPDKQVSAGSSGEEEEAAHHHQSDGQFPASPAEYDSADGTAIETAPATQCQCPPQRRGKTARDT